jgi:phasin family protein
MMMSFNPLETLNEFNKSALEQWIKFSQTSIENAERIANLNINTAKESLEEQVKHFQALPCIKDTQGWAAWRQKAAESQLDAFFGYARKVYETTSATQGEITKAVEESIQSGQKNLNAWVDNNTKSAPAGSDVAINALKNGIAATNAALDSINKASRQAAEATEAGVKAAVDATLNTVKKAQQQANQAFHTAANTAANAANHAHQSNKKTAN